MKGKKSTIGEWALTALVLVMLLFILLQSVFHIDLISPLAAALERLGGRRPVLTQGSGLGLVFLYGLLSSIHCVGMCGGIVLSMSAGRTLRTGILQNLQYQLSRVTAYSGVGLLLGAFGGVLSLPKAVQGYVPLVCGVLMLISGLSILLGQVSLPVPGWYARIFGRLRATNPLALGCLSALMPCGTMQAVQLYAVGCADAWQGMLAMLFFALGTVPLLFLIGVLSSLFKDRNWKWIFPLTSILVILLALQMIGKGLRLVSA